MDGCIKAIVVIDVAKCIVKPITVKQQSVLKASCEEMHLKIIVIITSFFSY